MVKNLTEAKKYVNKIKKGLIKNPFTNKDCTNSLKIFAKAKDEENFKIVVNSICSAIKTQKGLKLFKKRSSIFC